MCGAEGGHKEFVMDGACLSDGCEVRWDSRDLKAADVGDPKIAQRDKWEVSVQSHADDCKKEWPTTINGSTFSKLIQSGAGRSLQLLLF